MKSVYENGVPATRNRVKLAKRRFKLYQKSVKFITERNEFAVKILSKPMPNWGAAVVIVGNDRVLSL